MVGSEFTREKNQQKRLQIIFNGLTLHFFLGLLLILVYNLFGHPVVAAKLFFILILQGFCIMCSKPNFCNNGLATRASAGLYKKAKAPVALLLLQITYAWIPNLIGCNEV